MIINIPKEVQTVLETLNDCGFEAYVVGGCVRDSLLGVNPHDWDITTNAMPEQIKLCLNKYKTIDTGVKYGTITALINGMAIEITTYRTDGVYLNYRKPEHVSFVDDLRLDLSRRDFTINALAYHNKYGLIDYFGGKPDIDNKVIKCVGDADARFNEDALRIMRAARFNAVLGFDIEAKTGFAMTKNANLLARVSRERIASELNKALTGDYAASSLEKYTEIFMAVMPELKPMIGFEQRNRYHHLDVWNHTVFAVKNTPKNLCLRMAALLHDVGKPYCFTLDDSGTGHFFGHASISAKIAESVLLRFKYDNDTRNQVVYLIKHHCDLLSADNKSLRRVLNKMGEKTLRDMIELKRADCRAQSPCLVSRREQSLDEIVNELNKIILDGQVFSIKNLEINGNDLIDIGFNQGKDIGKMLNELRELVIDGKLENNRLKLMLHVEQILNDKDKTITGEYE